MRTSTLFGGLAIGSATLLFEYSQLCMTEAIFEARCKPKSATIAGISGIFTVGMFIAHEYYKRQEPDNAESESSESEARIQI